MGTFEDIVASHKEESQKIANKYLEKYFREILGPTTESVDSFVLDNYKALSIELTQLNVKTLHEYTMRDHVKLFKTIQDNSHAVLAGLRQQIENTIKI